MYINVLYEGDYCDCDIIFVPDSIGDKIEQYAQQFCDWLNTPYVSNDYYVTINGKEYLSLETDGFVRWLNHYICKDQCLAHIVKQHTNLVPSYKVIEF